MAKLMTERMENRAMTSETRVFEISKCVLMIIDLPQDHNITCYLFWKV